ncbi:MAG: DUF6249 domain-containing protein, partial [Bacteroidota bacterium]
FVVASLAIIGTFGTGALLIYMFFATRHKQRIALLEHGQEAKVFNTLRTQKDALKFGMLAIGVGIGVLVGYLLEEMGMEEEPAYFSMILIIGGAALIAFYLMDRKAKEE